MADGKKRMSSRRFMAIFIPITAVLLVSSIVITCVMEYWSTVMDAVFGEASISIQAADGTENWNTDYYGLTAEGMTPEEQAAEGKELARRAEGEGIVLLKNQNNALPLTNNGQPLSETNPITVNALGWSFYYPSTGGSGSGAVGSDGLVSPKEALAAAGIRINESFNEVYVRGEAVELSELEYQILLLLMRHPRKIFSAQNLYESVWNEPYFYNCSSTVMVHIRRLRVKIEEDAQNPRHIVTVWGKGYRFGTYEE